MVNLVVALDDAPCELQCAIREFWPELEWENAANVAWLESGFNAFAVADTRDSEHPCGAFLRTVGGVAVYAEFSVGYFQINVCAARFASWTPGDLVNARHNAGTAHMIWSDAGGNWSPWYWSARKLGLI